MGFNAAVGYDNTRFLAGCSFDYRDATFSQTGGRVNKAFSFFEIFIGYRIKAPNKLNQLFECIKPLEVRIESCFHSLLAVSIFISLGDIQQNLYKIALYYLSKLLQNTRLVVRLLVQTK